MPFVRKTNSQGSQPSTDTRKLFIGRTGELLFFAQNILKPEEPIYNIISIWPNTITNGAGRGNGLSSCRSGRSNKFPFLPPLECSKWYCSIGAFFYCCIFFPLSL